MHLAQEIMRSWLSQARRASWVGAVLLLVVFAAPVSGQNLAQSSSAAPIVEPAAASSGKLSVKEARDAKIASDAEKLYQMALDLKVEVDKSTKDTVSLSIAKRAAELEKLAKSLKQEMRAD